MQTASIALAVFCLIAQHPVIPSDRTSPAAENGPPESPGPSDGVVHMLKDGRPRFELLDTDGTRHKASLVQIAGDNVVLRSGRNAFTIPFDQLQRSSRRGDSPWDGALVGLSVGGGILALIEQDDPAAVYRWTSDNPDDWTVKDTISLLAISTTVGYLVDALHVGRHTVLVGPMRASPSKRSGALTLNVTGSPSERQLRIGYRLTF